MIKRAPIATDRDPSDLPDYHEGMPPGMPIMVDLIFLRETDKAILVQLPKDGPPRTAWLPKSKARVFHNLQGPSASVLIDGKLVSRKTTAIQMPLWLYRETRETMLPESVKR